MMKRGSYKSALLFRWYNIPAKRDAAEQHKICSNPGCIEESFAPDQSSYPADQRLYPNRVEQKSIVKQKGLIEATNIR